MKKAPVRFTLIAFSIFPLICSNNLQAQSTVMFENFLPSVVETNLRNQVLWEPYKSNNNSRRLPPESSQNLVKFVFKPILDLRKANLAKFVSKVRAKDRSGANQMEQIFASSDVIETLGRGLAPFGLRVDNVADAYTVYWMSAWQASVGRTDTFQRDEVVKVKSQVQLALLNVPEILNATSTQKQEFAESLLVQTALIEASMEQAAGNPDQLSAIASAVRQGARATGLDLDSMTLTSNGFIPTTRGSSVQDGDFSKPQNDMPVEKNLASSKVDGDSNPNYALIAAAGGAGLGGMFLLGKAMGRKR